MSFRTTSVPIMRVAPNTMPPLLFAQHPIAPEVNAGHIGLETGELPGGGRRYRRLVRCGGD